MRQLLKFSLISISALVLSVVIWGGNSVYQLYFKPLLKTNQPELFIINKNSSAFSIVNNWKAQGWINNAELVLQLIKIKKWAHSLKAGVYQVMPEDTVETLLKKIVAGAGIIENFKIIEGSTLAQVKTNLAKTQFLHYDEKIWQLIEKKYPQPEGLLLADTYNYNAGSEAKYIVLRAHQNLLSYLEQCWQHRDPTLPYKSSYELLIAASILEKEASIPHEKKIIAGVIVNRLKKNMPLQMDPTVIYALGSQYSGKLIHKDLEITSLYNTYKNRGLPPTPIAMVGKEALEAAAHPEVSDYLYFFAKGDGSHSFSANYEEQKKAINRYKNKGFL